MLFGNRRPRKLTARRPDHGAFEPRCEGLESKVLLSIDLGATSPPALPVIATKPYGMDFGGTATTTGVNPHPNFNGAGWSVSDVGDVNGDGYDDFLVGAPTLSGANPASLGNKTGSTVYLIFGSRTVGQTAITDWLSTPLTNPAPPSPYTPKDRVGDLSQLGAAAQTDPINSTGAVGGTPLANPFNGVTFYSGSNPNASLGASVSTVRLNSGQNAIIIGAPGAIDTTGTVPGTGRVYVVWGDFQANSGTTPINLDAAAPTGLNIVVFDSSVAGSALGRSVAGGSNILGDGSSDLILGAPSASVDGVGNAGAVYLIPTSALVAPNTYDVATVGQTFPGVVFSGANSGDQAGFSVADGGDVNAAGGGKIDDLLIGAPRAGSSTGAAYLVYGGSGLASLATVAGNPGVSFISLGRVGAPGSATGVVPGAIFTGTSGGDLTGFAVSSAGDFNGDGFGDILIGSPGWATSSGRVNMIYGAPNTLVSGTIPLSAIPTNIKSVEFDGGDTGDLAGYALTAVGFINVGQPNEILIGAPGYLLGANLASGNMGTAYLIPGRSGFTGTYSLAAAEAAPLSGIQFLLTTPSSGPAFFGASVSSRFQNGQAFTADGDNRSDFIIGAPGYDVTQTSANELQGGALIVQAGFITVQSLNVSPTPTPSPGPSPGTGGAIAGVPRGPVTFTDYISSTGANQYTPSLTELSALNYQPIPLSVALAQFLPPEGFRQRIYSFNHPGKHVGSYLINRGQNKGRASGINTLSSKVYDRSRFHAQKNYNWTHKPPKSGIVNGVIPTQTKRQVFNDQLLH
ncbi:MAG: hypothetical protein ACHRXM_31500 [Isosphaerales bacterium]